jgi:hypothetical protein
MELVKKEVLKADPNYFFRMIFTAEENHLPQKRNRRAGGFQSSI